MSYTGEAMEPAKFVPILEAIRDIFLRHNFLGLATGVADLIDLAHLRSSNFAAKLGGGEMWGGAGSVADSVGLTRSRDPMDAETERDSLELMRLLIKLAEQMKAQGSSRRDRNSWRTPSVGVWRGGAAANRNHEAEASCLLVAVRGIRSRSRTLDQIHASQASGDERARCARRSPPIGVTSAASARNRG